MPVRLPMLAVFSITDYHLRIAVSCFRKLSQSLWIVFLVFTALRIHKTNVIRYKIMLVERKWLKQTC